MKKEIIGQNIVRYTMKIKEMETFGLIVRDPSGSTSVRKDMIREIPNFLGIEYDSIEKLNVRVVKKDELIIDLEMKESVIKRVYGYSTRSLENLYQLFEGTPYTGTLLHSVKDYVFVPSSEFPDYVASEYCLKAVVAPINFDNYSVVSEDASADLIGKGR